MILSKLFYYLHQKVSKGSCSSSGPGTLCFASHLHMSSCRPRAELSLSSNNPVTWNILWSQKAPYSPCTNATQFLGRDPLSSSREICKITIISWLVSPNLLLHQSESICIIISSQNFIASVLILKTTEILKKLRYLQGEKNVLKLKKKSFKTEKKNHF